MKRSAYLKNFFAITALVVLLYIAAVNIGLFYIFSWYDSMMHILGGFAIGYLALYMVSSVSEPAPLTIPCPTKRIGRGAGSGAGRTLGYAALLALIIGILWEIFERVGNHFVPKLLAYGGTGDTIMDIACAIIGALFVAIITKKS